MGTLGGPLGGFPNLPALWLRRAKLGYANAIAGPIFPPADQAYLAGFLALAFAVFFSRRSLALARSIRRASE
jgi:hypothetical protein